MTKLLPFAVFLIGVPVTAAAQHSSVENEVRAFMLAYDSAVGDRDIAFLERVLPDDYVFTGASGRKSDRAHVLEYYIQERDKPSYRRISLAHENVVVHALSNMAVVTNAYTSQTAPLDGPTADPETIHGRHTGVFVKRTGRWMVLAEQDTEQPHDDKLIERQVTHRGREYNELMKRLADGRPYEELVQSGDIAALSDLLADGFTCTCGQLRITLAAQELERYKSSHVRLDSVDVLEQSAVAIDNNAAIEWGKVRYVGTDGTQRIDLMTRYTRTWVSWSRGWQVIAAHISAVTE